MAKKTGEKAVGIRKGEDLSNMGKDEVSMRQRPMYRSPGPEADAEGRGRPASSLEEAESYEKGGGEGGLESAFQQAEAPSRGDGTAIVTFSFRGGGIQKQNSDDAEQATVSVEDGKNVQTPPRTRNKGVTKLDEVNLNK